MPEENLYTKDCIRTFTGKYLNVFEPDPALIDIVDIAHALAHQPRFGGHLPGFYSVAQHSVHCAELAEAEHKLTALLHDSSEAYLMDIPSPIKNRMPEYKKIEDVLMHVIAEKFGFSWPMSEEVKRVDKEMLEIEWNGIMLKNNSRLRCWGHQEAKEEFLKKFILLTK